jgi:hypothetical protein
MNAAGDISGAVVVTARNTAGGTTAARPEWASDYVQHMAELLRRAGVRVRRG